MTETAADVTVAALTEAEEYAKTAKGLMREYGERVDRYLGDYKSSDPNWDSGRDEIEEKYARLRPAVWELARRVSGLIEQGRLKDLTRIELRLRLADFEGTLVAADKVFGVKG
jgi:hypothetical protein